MKSIKEYILELLSDIKQKWHPKKGLFLEKDPNKIAKYLLDNSKYEALAMERLVFYMNRAGENLENKEVLNKVKQILKK